MGVMITMSMNLNDIAILKIRCVYYHCIINVISKREAVNLLQNAHLSKNVDHYKTYFFFIVCIKDG